jgi:antitoxin MazE
VSALLGSALPNLPESNYVVITNDLIMQLSIIKIGNSKGVRLPKLLLEKYCLVGKVELELQDDGILLKPISPSKPREGWEESFRQMREQGDDALLIDDVFDDDNWEE